ncbi:MAG: calycin-like domain-containing protein, partial [Prevotella sp.]|nr:calycin-like domain-containing protein [Candidatus Prevotella equi]
MRKIFLTITVMSISMLFTACSDVDFTSHEYTPDAIGNNDWTGKPDTTSTDKDIPGMLPSNPFLAGTLVSNLADTYNGALTVSINGESLDPSEQNVIIRSVNTEGTSINFGLKNFILGDDVSPMPVGNIIIKDIALTKDENGNINFQTEQEINILAGDAKIDGEDVEMWLGPMLGPIPVSTKATGNKNSISILIDIDMQESLGQIINVSFEAPGNLEKDPKDSRFNGTPVSKFDKENTGTVTVEIDGTQLPSSTEHVTIMATDGTHFNFSLKNFILQDEESPMAVGTVKLKDVELKELPDGSIEMTY